MQGCGGIGGGDVPAAVRIPELQGGQQLGIDTYLPGEVLADHGQPDIPALELQVILLGIYIIHALGVHDTLLAIVGRIYFVGDYA